MLLFIDENGIIEEKMVRNFSCRIRIARIKILQRNLNSLTSMYYYV